MIGCPLGDRQCQMGAPCVSPTFCAACKGADRRKAAGEPPKHIPAVLWDEVDRKARERYGAAQSTYDALLWQLRERGISDLQKPDCRRRLADLSIAQARELVAALIRLKPSYPDITDDLIETLGGQLK